MNIIIIEDNKQIAENLKTQFELESTDNKVDLAYDGEKGLELIEINEYDCIILDLNLPDTTGEELSKLIRSKQITTPIIILTAKNSKSTIARNLILGADDYVTKPFNFEELLARIYAVIRRAENKVVNKVKLNEYTIDRNIQKVLDKNGTEISLSPKEYQLLNYLISKKGQTQRRLDIIENVWGDRDELLFSQTVDVHVAYLRKKLGKEIIKTGKEGYYVE